MKRLLIFFLLLFSLARGEAQTTTTSDRVVTKSLYLRDWWVDSVKRDTNFLGAVRSIPTAAAVYNFVAGRGAPGYTSVTALPDSSGLVFHGPNGLQDTVVFEGETGGSGSSLPSMTGNGGKYLTTDGTTASWGTISATYTPTITTSALTTLTLGTSYETYVFTGASAATWTLPAISGNTAQRLTIINKGTAELTLSGTMWNGGSVTTLYVLPGDIITFQNDGTDWLKTN
jgi:hypothetical protein